MIVVMKATFWFKAIFVCTVLLSPLFVRAGTEHNMSGWAWSSNIGWISFNCTNELNGCGSVDYGVNKNDDGTLTGYAWSSNIGWIQFGCPPGATCLSGFPTGSGTQSMDAKVNGNNLQGWARALSQGQGWDGWISLSGSSGSGSYGVDNHDGIHFTGYAWGGDVVGWIQFDASNGVQLSGDVSWDIRSGGQNGPSIANQTVAQGTVPTFTWSVTNLPNVSCNINKSSTGGTSLTPIYFTQTTSPAYASGGALIHSGNFQMLYDYTLTCTNPSISKSYSVIVNPEPASFTLGENDTAKIQFLNSGSADSEQKNIFVYPNAAFTSSGNPISISITTYPTPPSGTTFTYSLGGSAFSAAPSAVQIASPYSSGTTLKIRVSKPISTQYTVRLTGTSGSISATKDIILTPTGFDPKFQEF